ncbi:ACT domain-containing protein [Bacillaceae bacterium SIJ1]|nr:ACT domain-containing protein [Litoribacterium kuwaitense]
MQDLTELWDKTLEKIKTEVSKPSYEMWFTTTKIYDLNHSCLTVAVASENAKDWLSAHFTDLVADTVKNITGDALQIKFIVPPSGKQKADERQYSAKKATPFQPEDTSQGPKYFLVREDILPEAARKTLQAKELLERKKASTIHEAADRVGLSRSAFYRYRDAVYPFSTMVKDRIVSLFFHLHDHSGTLSRLLSIVAEFDCNVLTIHQTIPLQGMANVTLSMDISKINADLGDMLNVLRELDFIEKVELVGTGA